MLEPPCPALSIRVGIDKATRQPDPGVDEPRPASPPGGELAVAAVRSLDPHQVKLVKACRRGLAASGDPAFAAAAETVTGLR
jgi:hypothetical protein